MDVRKPVWTEWSFLLYAGGLTVLGAALAAHSYLSDRYGDAAYVAWTLLPLVVLVAVARMFHRRDEWVAAGVFAFAATAMWIAFFGAVENWWGWLPEQDSPFDGWHWGFWLLLLLVIAAAAAALRRYRFPLLVVYPLVAAYVLVTDVLSGGGSWAAVVTLFVGLVYLMIGVGVDGGARRPYGFWLHLVAGLLIGGALAYWWHSSDTDYALLATTGVVFVGISSRTRRSSWAVLGVIAFLASTVHWVSDWSNVSLFEPSRDWVPPLVFGIVGFFFVVLGLLAERRRRVV
jgi:hypothetical protein